MIKKIVISSILIWSNFAMTDSQISPSLDSVLTSYQTALKDLIVAHDQLYPKQPLQMNNDRLVAQTYQKLITPSIVWIQGYARLIASELARNFNVSADLNHLNYIYMSHEKDVQKIVKMFPKAVQNDASNVFYDAVASQVVQICYDIVKKAAYEYEFDQQTLQSVYQAYLLAWHAQTATMNVLGCKSQVEFQSNIFENMHTLFFAASNHYQSELQKGMVDSQSLQVTYKMLQWIAQVLSVVYTNNGDVQSAANQQAMMKSFALQEQSYQQAVSVEKQADATIQQARSIIELQVANAQTILSNVVASLKTCSAAQTLYQNAATDYQNSSDLLGSSAIAIKTELVNSYDILFRFVQKLWALFLIDQSSQGVYTLPTLASFVQGKASGQTDNAVQALNNLSAMISDQYVSQNNMISLTGSTQNLLMTTVLQDMQNFAQKVCIHHHIVTVDKLFNLPLLLQTNETLGVLVQWSNAVVQAMSNSDQGLMQDAMGYSKMLDDYFSTHADLVQLIPYLPDVLSTNQTWINFTAQLFVQSGLITQASQAVDLVATAKVQQPVTLTAQDLTSLEQKAQGLWEQAETFTKALNFVSAAANYQEIMTDYQTLYAHAADANTMIDDSQKANIAQTRFTALSFASTVQATGATTFATIKNIPNIFSARSYSLAIDSSLVNNSLPEFLSVFNPGTVMNKLTALQKQELLALVKAYLIAQYLNDQGLDFATYYSDYKLTVVQQSKRAGLAEEKISQYLQLSKTLDVVSVTMDSATTLTVVLSNFPLSSVTSLCSVLLSALEFYQSAALLLEPSTQTLTVGGQTYVSGNDSQTASVMYQKAAYAYLAQASNYLKQAQVLIQQTLAVIGKGTTLPENFSNTLNKISGLFLQAQALVYKKSDDSAYAYFLKAGLQTQAQAVQAAFLAMYETQIEFGQKCLVGDPISNDYQNLISTINQWYVTWGTQDPTAINTLNQKIAQLYEIAGSAALKFEYVQDEFPNFKQIHYMTAASYFRSAQQQYKFLNNQAQVQALQSKIENLFFQATIQNLNIYFYVKQHGASYISAQKQSIPVTFDQLSSDYMNAMSNGANIDPNEMTLYKDVQDLLIDAAIVLQHLQSAKTRDAATVLDYLQKNNTITSDVSDFSQISLNLSEKIIMMASTLYQQFLSNPSALAACAELLFEAVKNQYLQDYFGITLNSDAQNLANDTQEFLASMQNEVLNLTNPSIGYVQ